MFRRQTFQCFVRTVDHWISETAEGEMLPVDIEPYEGEPPNIEEALKQATRSQSLLVDLNKRQDDFCRLGVGVLILKTSGMVSCICLRKINSGNRSFQLL